MVSNLLQVNIKRVLTFINNETSVYKTYNIHDTLENLFLKVILHLERTNTSFNTRPTTVHSFRWHWLPFTMHGKIKPLTTILHKHLLWNVKTHVSGEWINLCPPKKKERCPQPRHQTQVVKLKGCTRPLFNHCFLCQVRFADDVTTVKQQRKTENRSQISLSKKNLELHVLEYPCLNTGKTWTS